MINVLTNRINTEEEKLFHCIFSYLDFLPFPGEPKTIYSENGQRSRRHRSERSERWSSANFSIRIDYVKTPASNVGFSFYNKRGSIAELLCFLSFYYRTDIR